MSHPGLIVDGVTIKMPTTHGWQPTSSLGVGGSGSIVLTAFWVYRMNWEALTPEDFKELYDIWFDNQGQDIIVSLPELGVATYVLKSYTARANPVIFGGFFEGHYLAVATELAAIDITA